MAAVATIEPFLARPRGTRVLAGIDRVFFSSSATQSFASGEARSAFRTRWLGRYLDCDPQHAFLALSSAGSDDETVAGYIVGSLDDPARAVRFDDLSYFKTLAHLTARFPAQLHVNLLPEWRGQGLGRALVEAFCRHAAQHGAPGVHVFTGRGLRNVRFYEAAGFREAGCVDFNGREIVMLARSLL